jgi:hypothetical protein
MSCDHALLQADRPSSRFFAIRRKEVYDCSYSITLRSLPLWTRNKSATSWGTQMVVFHGWLSLYGNKFAYSPLPPSAQFISFHISLPYSVHTITHFLNSEPPWDNRAISIIAWGSGIKRQRSVVPLLPASNTPTWPWTAGHRLGISHTSASAIMSISSETDTTGHITWLC